MATVTGDYPDTNGNGIPDAFEKRPPLTEILNAPEGSLDCDFETVVVELEKVPRAPKRGEWYIGAGKIERADITYSTFETIVIRRVIGGKLP